MRKAERGRVYTLTWMLLRICSMLCNDFSSQLRMQSHSTFLFIISSFYPSSLNQSWGRGRGIWQRTKETPNFRGGLVQFAGEPNKGLRWPKRAFGAYSREKPEVKNIRSQMSTVSISFLFPYVLLLDSSCFKIFHGLPFPENKVKTPQNGWSLPLPLSA